MRSSSQDRMEALRACWNDMPFYQTKSSNSAFCCPFFCGDLSGGKNHTSSKMMLVFFHLLKIEKQNKHQSIQSFFVCVFVKKKLDEASKLQVPHWLQVRHQLSATNCGTWWWFGQGHARMLHDLQFHSSLVAASGWMVSIIQHDYKHLKFKIALENLPGPKRKPDPLPSIIFQGLC